MKNRSSYAVLTRFGIIAAILATLVFIAPAVSAADPLEFDYAENGEDPVATFTASDPDADAGDIEWSVSGVDGSLFEIPGGVLSFKDSPDFEGAKDGDEDIPAAGDQGKGDNKYQITVVANDGEQAVEVTVTDEDEPGKVTFDQPQPQATRSLEAIGPKDPDGGVDEISWQWSRGPTADGPWTEIAGATTAKRTPGTDDINMWLQATVTYVDVHADQSESGVTDNFVEGRTLANAQPKFDDVADITVSENKDGKIGEPVVASDGDNDVLLYDVDDASTAVNPNDSELFSVDNNGQLSLTDAEDFEAPTGTTTRTQEDGAYVFNVVIKATDPSRASGSVTVKVLLEDVNESPEFAKNDDGDFIGATLHIVEDGTTAAEGPGLSPTAAGAAAAADQGTTAITYAATDDDNSVTDRTDVVTYKLEGADKDSFSLTDAGALTTLQRNTEADPEVAGLKANFESKSSYSITIVAVSADGDDTDTDDRDTTYGRLDVTVKVVDREDMGSVKLSARQSQVNIPLVASHTDEDGGVTDAKWQWYRGGTLPELSTLSSETDGILLVTGACVVDDADAGTTQTPATDLCRIADETSALYTPGSNDVGRLIHVVVNYKDDFDSDARENAGESSGAAVQASSPANTRPTFPDQDFNTPGVQSDVAMRSVAENFKGKIGEPIPASDADVGVPTDNPELLTYTIDDEDNFSVDQTNGQISTAVELDYETQSMYTVMLTATDPSGARATITVMIEVTDEDDKAVITGVETIDYAENGEDPVATFTASDPDADAGDIEWSVSGVDGSLFEIPGGVLSFKDSPDFEGAKDGDEDIPAAGDQGKGDNKYQITVVANEGEQAVEVTVTDEDEPGKVTFDQPQPQATRSLGAIGTGDPDGGIDEISWQWSLGPTADGPWTEIAGATTAKRTPGTDDIGSWLQATVTYVDVHGDQSESGVTDNAVEARTLANAAPKFDDVDAIEVPENKDGKIGEPVVASDGDNDVLLYDVDTASTADDPNDNAMFSVDNNGQLSLNDPLDFEDSAKTANDAGFKPYTVVLRATDPSRASVSVTVTVLLEDVNESPEFAKNADGDFIGATLHIVEDGTTAAEGPGLSPTAAGAAAAADQGTTAITYAATDDDNSVTDRTDVVTYKLEGADKDSFSLTDAGALTTLQRNTEADPEVAGLKANFESKSSYSITIVAVSADGDDTDTDDRDTTYGRLDVTVKVVDREDMGSVKLSARQSQVNIPLVASHSDEDDGVTDAKWQWYRGSTLPTDLSTLLVSGGTTLTATIVCVNADPDDADVTQTPATDLCRIADETSALYTPGSNDVGRIIHVVVDYKDDFNSDVREQAGKSSDATVQASNPANTRPTFPDQDFNTPGVQSAVAMRSVPENFKGKIGEPIPATDADVGNPAGNPELLTYMIDDTDNFGVDQTNGQISTAVELDYETQSMYTVMLTATDPSGARATITVMIEVTDEDDKATVRLSTAPEFDGETDERSVAENSAAGTAVGDPVVATDRDTGDSLTYSLDAMGDMYFDIDDMGQITVGEGTMLDFESGMTSHTVTVTATDTDRLYDMITVTIMVVNVNEAPVFASGTAMRSVDENTPVGTEIGPPITATDVDEGATLTYSLGGDDAASFAIDAATGQLTTMAALDHETKSSYTVTVMVSDGELYAEITVMVTVSVDNVNEAPTFDALQAELMAEVVELSVDENTEAGMAIGDAVAAMDVDADDTLTYSLDEMGDMYFDIDSETGQLMTEAALDYESGTTSYSVTVTATDSGGLSDTIAVTIAVNDVPETPIFDADAVVFTVAENTPVGTAVGTVTAIDGESYSDDLDYFDVDNMGNITTAMMFDYEGADTSFTGTVTATGGDGSTDTITVTVTVGDMHPGCTMADNMGLTNDCEALLDAKGDLGGSLNWDTDTAMDDWEGVTMSDGRVSRVWLRDEGLDGSVSAALGRLDMLTVLNLHTNMLSGPIPDLSGATMLEELYLANNAGYDADGNRVNGPGLTGEIPAWLNGMANMTELWLWGNGLSGSVPDLSGMTSLDKLKLANNDLDGGLPTADMLPPNMTWLIIDRNDFGGEIPDLSSLSSLKLLWLHSSELTGSVPSGGMLPASLDDLNLRDNMLSGDIPDLSALDNLTRLRLHNNSLSGAVPGSLGGLDSLKSLWLHNEMDDEGMLVGGNAFTSIEDGVGDLANTLEVIALSGNNWDADACVPIALADVATNDYGPDNIEVCPADDGS